jgi:virginiamycin B lyase
VAPAPDGRVWYTPQGSGGIGLLDPKDSSTVTSPTGGGSSPHGVIVGPDGAGWVTDSGLDAIVRYDPKDLSATRFPLPGRPGANLNTAAFDGRGRLWYTGQNGYHGSVDPATKEVRLYNSPRGRGPYGICATPSGDIYYASLAGSHIAKVNLDTGEATVIEPPTRGQGARRVWSDSRGDIWVSEWNAGQVGRYSPGTGAWKEWRLPGSNPQCYAVFVDDRDIVWLTDFGANAIVRFDPASEQFTSLPLPKPNAAVRQILGRPGEVWGAMSGAEALIVVRT